MVNAHAQGPAGERSDTRAGMLCPAPRAAQCDSCRALAAKESREGSARGVKHDSRRGDRDSGSSWAHAHPWVAAEEDTVVDVMQLLCGRGRGLLVVKPRALDVAMLLLRDEFVACTRRRAAVRAAARRVREGARHFGGRVGERPRRELVVLEVVRRG